MPQGAVPRRYAEAAFNLANAKGNLDRWRADLRMAVGVLSDPRLRLRLEDPNTHSAEKRKLIDGAFTVALDPDVRNLLYLLADRGRFGGLQRIVTEFIEMANRAQGIVVAEVTTAVPLDEAAQQDVSARLKQLVNAKQVELHNQVDPAILGGIVAR
ncbi:MAG TPA: ATP synthase F1 subunit delta, partial [Chloroflexia bacterium]|nr:ATP synthase F1 subunit delta [Chloroflexia bacterium]